MSQVSSHHITKHHLFFEEAWIHFTVINTLKVLNSNRMDFTILRGNRNWASGRWKCFKEKERYINQFSSYCSLWTQVRYWSLHIPFSIYYEQHQFHNNTVLEIRKAIGQSIHHPSPICSSSNPEPCMLMWCVFLNSSVAVLVTDRDILIHRCTVDFQMHWQRTHIELELLCGLHHIFINDSLNPFDF